MWSWHKIAFCLLCLEVFSLRFVLVCSGTEKSKYCATSVLSNTLDVQALGRAVLVPHGERLMCLCSYFMLCHASNRPAPGAQGPPA